MFVAAEYNHSITASLKKALDQAYVEWVRKPISALGYGSTGGVRAVEHLRYRRRIQMRPLSYAVEIGGSEILKVHPFGANADITAIDDVIRPSRTRCSTTSSGGPTPSRPPATPTASAAA